MPVIPLPPIEQIPPPSGAAEKQLAAVQRRLTKAENDVAALVRQRDQMMASLSWNSGYKQRRLAEIISHGAVAGGGQPLTEHAVQRALRIMDGRMARTRRP